MKTTKRKPYLGEADHKESEALQDKVVELMWPVLQEVEKLDTESHYGEYVALNIIAGGLIEIHGWGDKMWREFCDNLYSSHAPRARENDDRGGIN